MPVITLDQISASYSAAKEVEAGRLSKPAAARELNLSCGMSIGSAENYIQVFQSLRTGAVYKRMLSVEASRFFLKSIQADFGAHGIRLALESVRRHIRYLEQRGEGAVPALRAVVANFDTASALESLESMAEYLHVAVQASKADPRSQRLDRLERAQSVPQRVEVRTYQYVRNADVIIEVLLRAAGRCEDCDAPAPFTRASDDSPYLEVHHIVHLSAGGEDTVANAVALCPNCHRRAHFGPKDS